MAEPRLTDQQIRRLLKFKGYGNPAGRYWFIGMEEGGDHPWEEMVGRADTWREVEDLAHAPRPWAPEFRSTLHMCHTSTWWMMCQIVGRLSSEPAWCDTSHGGFVRGYQSKCLGRRCGKTFLTEILPLPKKNISDWPFESLYATRDEYEEAVLSERLRELRNLFDRYEPEYVLCYGKSFWPHHRQVFSDAEFTSILDGKAQISTLGRSTIGLTAFLDPTVVGKTVDFIEELCSAVEAARTP